MKNSAKLCVLVAVVTSTLWGCAFVTTPVFGAIYTGVEHGDEATGVAVGQTSGESCATSILGIVATGDASVTTAARQGGISTISYVDHKSTSILGVYAEYCTIVYGQSHADAEYGQGNAGAEYGQGNAGGGAARPAVEPRPRRHRR